MIAEFGEKRRVPINYEQIPEPFVQAILAAEDSRYFDHGGIDFKGLARAAFQLASTGRIKTGGSTITMQVARNYLLTLERTFIRKFKEIILSLQMERQLSKKEILELYVNKIYLGNRAYGIQAAANVYYGRDIDQLTLAELAMIAGLPKAPSAYNPLANPPRALERRNWILARMQRLGYIDSSQMAEAQQAPITAAYHGADIELYAPYIAEMVRSDLLSRYGESIYIDGFNAYTTIRSADQRAANQAVVAGLMAYELRHGYRGAEQQWDASLTEQQYLDKLRQIPSYASLEPAVVLAVSDPKAELQNASLLLRTGELVELNWDGISWARPFKSVNSRGPEPTQAAQVLAKGDLVRLLQTDKGWVLRQIPQVQSALVSLSTKNGAIRALVGGFSFQQSKFNRVVQGTRQPGSNFKPFVYTAALASGFTPASIINDAPVVFEDKNLESSWRPENYSKEFFGPTRFREALYKSRNLVSIRILRTLGVKPTLEYIQRFGFDGSRLPKNLSLALGSADVTPLELATGYAVFANGGFKVEPYWLERVTDRRGDELYQAQPMTVCEGCIYVPEPDQTGEDASLTELDTPPLEQELQEGETLTSLPLAPRIIDEQTAYLINNIMQDVIKRGTGRKAGKLGRKDLAGKTGTTNDLKDAWFSGFNRDLVASVWVGFDQPQTLGRREFGSTAALPIWIDYMEQALQGLPEAPLIPPQGIVSVRIDPETGLLAYPGQKNAIFEVFRKQDVPTAAAVRQGASASQDSSEDLF
ncbi:penicillin-binding protein 1A [Motiliproteus coralliicola]|uniref:penicillin-binding protein 1A n=1 Tax=Motiliproteus coralliicola TaxID=2283196 RepID=UPI001FB4CA86|nr:penicillin-binding protein 1A [Motiliproteus coralliicola]